MSLPPKLLERLKKRGIIHQKDESQSKRLCNAESRRQSSVIGCPNKYNQYHDCGTYCELKYGLGTESPLPKIKKIYDTLVEYCPLNEDWQSVYEPGCGRFYFYNIHTNMCSWYPPGHPKFKSTKSANSLRAERDNGGVIDAQPHEQSDDKIIEELDRFDAELNSELKSELTEIKAGDQQFGSHNSDKAASEGQSNESDIEHDEEQSDEANDENDGDQSSEQILFE